MNKLKDKPKKEQAKTIVEPVEEKKEKKEKKDKKEKKEKKEKKKATLKTDSIDLLISTDQNHQRSEADYNELLSPDHENLPAINSTETNINQKIQNVISFFKKAAFTCFFPIQ